MATHDSSIVNRRKKRVLQLKDGKLMSDVDQGRYV
jgi:ABC-type ATPase involved in cell division